MDKPVKYDLKSTPVLAMRFYEHNAYEILGWTNLNGTLVTKHDGKGAIINLEIHSLFPYYGHGIIDDISDTGHILRVGEWITYHEETGVWNWYDHGTFTKIFERVEK